jgi:hypothetical protein
MLSLASSHNISCLTGDKTNCLFSIPLLNRRDFFVWMILQFSHTKYLCQTFMTVALKKPITLAN